MSNDVKTNVKNNNNEVIKMFVISLLTSLFVMFCFTPYIVYNTIRANSSLLRKQINVVSINGIPIYQPVKYIKECKKNRCKKYSFETKK